MRSDCRSHYTIGSLRALLFCLIGSLLVFTAACGTKQSAPVSSKTPVTNGAAASQAAADNSAKVSTSGLKGQVTLQWTSLYQAYVDRFEIFRGPTRNGPWTRITTDDDILLGHARLDVKNRGDEPIEYKYTDKNLEPGARFWYYVAQVDLAGNVSPYTRNPVERVAVDPAKAAPGENPPVEYAIGVAPPGFQRPAAAQPSASSLQIATPEDASPASDNEEADTSTTTIEEDDDFVLPSTF